jgi:hypothetical protein
MKPDYWAPAYPAMGAIPTQNSTAKSSTPHPNILFHAEFLGKAAQQ